MGLVKVIVLFVIIFVMVRHSKSPAKKSSKDI